jgi:adenosylcobalamin-dependent ribonucleoside-triphosphate reductase
MSDPPNFKDHRVMGTNPCGEQSLESYELCNLVETFPINHKNIADYAETLKYAYLYAKTVTLMRTHDSRTNQVMTRNRRIGLSQSGIVENLHRVGFRQHMVWSDDGYDIVCGWDKTYSEWLGVPESIKKTTVKPSGSVSLLPGVTPGIHYPHSEYYIRRIRVAKTSHLVAAMIEAGYHVEPDLNLANSTVVVDFPVHEPYFTKSKKDVSMMEQLELASQMQSYWSDNQVSVTVTIKEGEDVAMALSMYETRLKSVSFLPISDHGYKQAPYEEITKDIYEEMLLTLKKPKLNIGMEDDGKAFDQFCDADVCEVL